MSEQRTPDEIRGDLKVARLSNRLLRERIEASRLGTIERHHRRRGRLLESMSLDWVTPYAELLDRFRSTGDPILTGPSSYWQRKGGKNWPIYQTEAELNLLRAPARLLVATNSYAQGLIEGLTSYVIGPGYTYRVAKRDWRSEVPDDLVTALQRVVDTILQENQWYGGEQPGLEEELFGRSVEDGEFFLAATPQDDGRTQFRTLEPEQVTKAPGAELEGGEDGAFGVITPADDVQDVQGYWVQWGDSPTDGERYDPDCVTHLRRNVRRSMKRGLSDFTFDAYDALDLASKLRNNLGDGAAQQAAIVGVRQHATGSQSDIEAFAEAQAEFTATDPLTSQEQRIRRTRRGTWEEVPEGLQYVPGPGAQNAPAHLQVLQACLRGGGVKWNAPEWLASADASNNNYSSSLTAESPFVRTVVRRQRGYREAFRRPVWAAVRHWVDKRGIRAGGRSWTWEEIEAELDLLVEAPSPETRNKLQEAQQAQIEIPLGVDSRQQYAQRQGRDWDQVEADNQEFDDQHGGAAGSLPLPGEGGGLGGAGARTDPFGGAGLGESVLAGLGESLARSLLESGFTGEITDKAGRTRRYVDGKPVAIGAHAAGGGGRDVGGGGGGDGGDGPTRDHVLGGLAEKIAATAPEVAKNPALMQRLGDAALTGAAKAYGAFVRLTPHLMTAQAVLEGVFDTPSDMGKFGYNPTMTSQTSNAGVKDVVKDNLGISAHLAATIASHVLGRAWVFAANKLRGGKAESEQGDAYDAIAAALHEAVAAVAAELGLPAPPAADAIAAKLRERAAK